LHFIRVLQEHTPEHLSLTKSLLSFFHRTGASAQIGGVDYTRSATTTLSDFSSMGWGISIIGTDMGSQQAAQTEGKAWAHLGLCA